MELTIKNGHVVDPANGIDTVLDVYIKDGIIEAVAENLTERGEVIDAQGLYVSPGFIDMHVHLRTPGQEHKEDMASGTAAAVAGGFTAVCCMPNTVPVVDNEITVNHINMLAQKQGKCRVHVIGSITKGQQGEQMSNIGLMKDAGIVAISDDGVTVENPALLKTAMKYATMFDLPVLSHCEDKKLAGSGQIHAGLKALELGLGGIGADSEEVIVSRDIILAKSTGARLHICHVSTAGSVELIRRAKAEGVNVTAEVTPHHFTLTDADIPGYDTNYKMSPPLRSEADRLALIEGLKDGTIDAIATDHAPHHFDEKNHEFAVAPNGIIGLETAFGLAVTKLLNKGELTISELIEKMSVNPAKILGVSGGCLSVGKPADITIFDTNTTYTIDASTFQSKSRNTPFDGYEVCGSITYTIVGGQIVYGGKA